jgi:hypothetical protein
MIMEPIPDYREIFKNTTSELKERFSRVRLLVLDFDGTLTDNKVYTSETGSSLSNRIEAMGSVSRCSAAARKLLC